MTGWNLPPGVNVNDIPGNRPEDGMEEAFWAKLEDGFSDEVIGVVDQSEELQRMIRRARDIGYTVGHVEGKIEAYTEATAVVREMRSA